MGGFNFSCRDMEQCILLFYFEMFTVLIYYLNYENSSDICVMNYEHLEYLPQLLSTLKTKMNSFLVLLKHTYAYIWVCNKVDIIL